MEKTLPPIPAKRYFTIGEVSDLCGVKPYVLRYWEQEFTQLKPMKRRGNRRYYQHHEVLLIRRIRELLYDQGFTISGARNRLSFGASHAPDEAFDALADGDVAAELDRDEPVERDIAAPVLAEAEAVVSGSAPLAHGAVASEQPALGTLTWQQVRDELASIRAMLFTSA